jgi:RHS repeat-associated protein
VRDPDGLSVVRYADLGRRQTRKTFGNNLVEERTYGPAAWLKTLTVSNASGPSPLLALDYATRNLRGLKLDVVRSDRGTKDVYTYDAAGRITYESLSLPEPPPEPPAAAVPEIRNVYTLDGLLNIEKRERTQAGATVVSEPGPNASGVNTRNQYTQWGTSPAYETLTYDPNGNMTAYSGATLRYDGDNRLTTATTAAGSYKAFHDPDGQRVREVRSSGGSTVELDVVQSGQRILEVFPKDATTPIQRFVYGRGIDEVVLAELHPTATGSTTAVYPLQDELGNVTHLTDQSGAVVERYQYEGYGKFRIFDPANSPRTVSSFGWNRLFQGREHMGMFDGYGFRARTLWPELGRFGQEDPAGTGDSLNLYQALGTAWTTKVDPLGEFVIVVEATGTRVSKKSNATLRLFSEDGHALFEAAAAVRGKHQDRSWKDGDTPFGAYLIAGRKDHDPARQEYGSFFFPMEYIAGENVQFMERYGGNRDNAGIGIHGGGSGLVHPQVDRQGWVNTLGCIRLQNEDLGYLASQIEALKKNGDAYGFVLVGDREYLRTNLRLRWGVDSILESFPSGSAPGGRRRVLPRYRNLAQEFHRQLINLGYSPAIAAEFGVLGSEAVPLTVDFKDSLVNALPPLFDLETGPR